ncbi:MAG: hypothetical protein F6K04_07830 [Leptolyngbya sp. SIO4C5]|nr:hypothetical protein [Leptolyngbya sp. SIO4C5]
MPDKATSINGILIRLPDERWHHIMQRHADLTDKKDWLLQTISSPTRLLAGNEGALMAIREIKPGKWLVVIYKEDDDDGFVVTAFSTRKINALNRRHQLWP